MQYQFKKLCRLRIGRSDYVLFKESEKRLAK